MHNWEMCCISTEHIEHDDLNYLQRMTMQSDASSVLKESAMDM